MSIVKQIYIHVVLVITLVITLVSTATLLVGALSLVTFTGYIDSYEQFAQNNQMNCVNQVSVGISDVPTKPILKKSNDSDCKKTDTELHTMYDQMVTTAKQNESRNEVNNILKAIPWIIVSLPIFIWFNKMRKEDK